MAGNKIAPKNRASARFFISKTNMKFILGQKIGMSQLFDKDGKMIPVTLVSAGPCYVLQKKTKEPFDAAHGKKDGYDAVQIGFEKITKMNKLRKSWKARPYKYVKEFRAHNSGTKMPGRMGYERISVKNLKIMKVDKENNLLVLKGAVPGHKGTLLEIRV